jgi:hypothetical protein
MTTTNKAGAAGQAAALPEVLPPVELLRQLDGWLDNTGHDSEHPWRVCIGATLAAYGIEALTVRADHAAHLFRKISEALSCVHENLPPALDADTEGLIVSAVAHAGWLADAAAVAHGGKAARGDAGAWFLSRESWKAMQAAEAATGAKGGAA